MNILSNLREQLDLMAFQCKRAVQYIMESDKGINDKVGFNTLVDSNIYNEIEVDADDWGLIKLLVNDYIVYIESGRKKGSFPPPQAIASWCSRKGIPNDNNTVFAICMSIFKYGISARPIMNYAFDLIDEYWDDWSNSIFEILTENLTEFFND